MTNGDRDEQHPEWFVAGPGNKPYGPYSFVKLKQYVTDGRLRHDSMVHRQGTDTWVRASELPGLFPRPAPIPVQAAPPSSATTTELPRCATCGVGRLAKLRVYRMSTPVVVIGYILLVPSILGIIASFAITVLLIVGTASGATGSAFLATQENREMLERAGVPKTTVDTVLAGKLLSKEQLQALTPKQNEAISTVYQTPGGYLSAGVLCCGSLGVAGGISSMITSFVGGLIGWLLVMKQTVLRCQRCGVSLPAS